MKKLFTLLLSLALLLGCCVSQAEAPVKTELGSINMNGAFRLQCTLPEDYEIAIGSKDDEGLTAVISAKDETMPMMFLAIEFDEIYYDVKRMNDMTEEQLQQIIDTFSNDGDEVTVSYRETSHGTKLMIVQEVVDSVDYLAIVSVYEGYMIEFDLMASAVAEEGLTESQIQMCIDFLSDLDFIPEEA